MTLVPLALAASLFVECENFEKLGGWIVETQSMRQLGSSYVMAHGYGKPVADAETKVDFPAEGEYTVWARTRNWNAEWTKGAAGRFKVAVGTEKTPFAWESEELGVGDKAWHWQKAGVVRLVKGTEYVVRLHDLTGFNGRCDALYFTTEGDTPPDDAEMDAWRHRQTGIVVKDDPGEYDLVVVGGGMAGCCAALTASRLGVKTLLLQDRDVLGGCNSSEVRVGLGGRMHTKPYPALGEVMKDIQPLVSNNSPLDGKYYEDDRKATAFELKDIRVWQTPGVKPFLKFRQYVYAVEMSSNRMTAVVARDTHTGAETRYRAKLFCDATGDAVLARLAGCETMYGCEARSRFHESCAPEKASRQVMGHSVQWLSKRCETASPFPDIGEWALPIDEQSGRYQRVGSWEQETGFFRDMADDTERIRDYGLLAVFSNWHWIKNRSEKRDEYANDAFSWISPIGGKRERYRVVGDYVLTQNELENHTETPDATAAITWGIDFHFPDPENAKSFAEPFRAVAYHRGTGSDHPVPYRCLYARDCENLFLAGRDISVSHCAFAAVRVMRTLGMLGEVVGMASAICREEKCLPRDVYAKHLDKLKKRMTSGAPKLPDFHGYEVGMAESYDLNHRGWRQIYPRGKRGELDEKMKEEIRGYGYAHRNEHPDLQSARRRLVLADESRAKVHYYDSFCPTDGFAVAVKKPVWDLKRVGAERYRIVCHGGFQVVDLKKRKVVDEFSYPDFKEWMATAVCDLKDGGFVFSVNPSGAEHGKAIHFYEFGADRKLRRIMKLAGYFNARSMERGRDGEWLVAHEKGFARIRLPEQGETVELVKNYPQPAGRNLFAVIPARTGGGYLAGCGYGGGLVRFNAEGEAVSQWFVPTDTGKESRFYAQVEERENGNIYLAHWTGHGEDDSFKGWQVVEFDPSGKVVWHLDSPDRFGSISGVIVLEDYSVPAAKMPEEKHVFSMSCKVTACNGDLATAEGRAKAIARRKRGSENGIIYQ